MKKIIVFLFIITILLTSIKDNKIIIPKESIRFRIIANSNDLKDQEIKNDIKLSLEPVIENIVDVSNIDESRDVIKSNIPLIKEKITSVTKDYSINYGYNYFPEKTYKDVVYQEGEYESVVITLGNGLGDNWWCVLFPPLCLLEAEEDNLSDVNYSFYIKKIIDTYN